MAGLTQGLVMLPSPPIKPLIIIDPAISLPWALHAAPLPSAVLSVFDTCHPSCPHRLQLCILGVGEVFKVPGGLQDGRWVPSFIPHLKHKAKLLSPVSSGQTVEPPGSVAGKNGSWRTPVFSQELYRTGARTPFPLASSYVCV